MFKSSNSRAVGTCFLLENLQDGPRFVCMVLRDFLGTLQMLMHEKQHVRSLCYSSVREYMDRVKRIWYLSPMRAAKVQASLRIRAVSPEPSLLAHTSSESRGTFRQKARSLAPLNGWACAVKVCHDGMLEDTNSLDGAHMFYFSPKWDNFL